MKQSEKKVLVLCAGCGGRLHKKHACRPNLVALTDKKLESYRRQMFSTPGPRAVGELVRIRDDVARRLGVPADKLLDHSPGTWRQ